MKHLKQAVSLYLVFFLSSGPVLAAFAGQGRPTPAPIDGFLFTAQALTNRAAPFEHSRWNKSVSLRVIGMQPHIEPAKDFVAVLNEMQRRRESQSEVPSLVRSEDDAQVKELKRILKNTVGPVEHPYLNDFAELIFETLRSRLPTNRRMPISRPEAGDIATQVLSIRDIALIVSKISSDYVLGHQAGMLADWVSDYVFRGGEWRADPWRAFEATDRKPLEDRISTALHGLIMEVANRWIPYARTYPLPWPKTIDDRKTRVKNHGVARALLILGNDDWNKFKNPISDDPRSTPQEVSTTGEIFALILTRTLVEPSFVFTTRLLINSRDNNFIGLRHKVEWLFKVGLIEEASGIAFRLSPSVRHLLDVSQTLRRVPLRERLELPSLIPFLMNAIKGQPFIPTRAKLLQAMVEPISHIEIPLTNLEKHGFLKVREGPKYELDPSIENALAHHFRRELAVAS